MDDITVVVADPDPLFAETLALALQSYPGLAISGFRPDSGPDLVRAVVDDPPAVVVADYWMRHMEGPAATAAILAATRQTRVILLLWLFGPREVAYGFAAGAPGLIPKSATLDELTQAIHAVAEGQERVCPHEVELIADNLGPSHVKAARTWKLLRSLTYREFQILNLLGDGRGLKEISGTLNIAPSTTQTHIHRILEKTGTTTRHQAAAMARSYGVAPA